MNLSPQAWIALWLVLAMVAVLVAYCLGSPLLERFHGNRFNAEAERYAEDEKQWWLLHRIAEDAARVEREARR